MTKKGIIAFVLVIILVVGCIACRKIFVAMQTVETAEDVRDTRSLPGWLCYLPASAKNISYCKVPFLNTAYEYEVGEEEFLEWAEEENIQLTPIESSTKVFRYSSHLLAYPSADDPNQWDVYEAKRMATVKQGYEYHTEQDNGGRLDIVYDSEKQKAYHYHSFR